MDGMNGTEWAALQAERQAERDARDAARMRHEARRHTYAVLYLGRAWRVEANLDAEYGAEWTLNEASMLADENATLTAQLTHYDSMRTRHTLLQIANDDLRGECASLKRELEALREERDTLAAKLDAANAKLAALENAALVATPDPDTTTHPLVARVAVLDVDTLAPLEALTELLLLKRMLAGKPADPVQNSAQGKTRDAMVLAPDDDARPMDREAQRPMTPTFEPPTRKPAA